MLKLLKNIAVICLVVFLVGCEGCSDSGGKKTSDEQKPETDFSTPQNAKAEVVGSEIKVSWDIVTQAEYYQIDRYGTLSKLVTLKPKFTPPPKYYISIKTDTLSTDIVDTPPSTDTYVYVITAIKTEKNEFGEDVLKKAATATNGVKFEIAKQEPPKTSEAPKPAAPAGPTKKEAPAASQVDPCANPKDDCDSDGISNFLEKLAVPDSKQIEVALFVNGKIQASPNQDGSLRNPFSSIGQAMTSAAQSSNKGKTIGVYVVGNHTYSEAVRISQDNIKLIGSLSKNFDSLTIKNPKEMSIISTRSASTAIEISNAQNVSLMHFKATAIRNVITLSNTKNATINSNRLISITYGIYFTNETVEVLNSESTIISNNIILAKEDPARGLSNATIGLALKGTKNCTIINNLIFADETKTTGIDLNKGVYTQNGGKGILLLDNSDASIINNIIFTGLQRKTNDFGIKIVQGCTIDQLSNNLIFNVGNLISADFTATKSSLEISKFDEIKTLKWPSSFFKDIDNMVKDNITIDMPKKTPIDNLKMVLCSDINWDLVICSKSFAKGLGMKVTSFSEEIQFILAHDIEGEFRIKDAVCDIGPFELSEEMPSAVLEKPADKTFLNQNILRIEKPKVQEPQIVK
ncbi:MAG: hypothetical protein ABIE74_08150 [Pseudomonadota bacterium]